MLELSTASGTGTRTHFRKYSFHTDSGWHHSPLLAITSPSQYSTPTSFSHVHTRSPSRGKYSAAASSRPGDVGEHDRVVLVGHERLLPPPLAPQRQEHERHGRRAHLGERHVEHAPERGVGHGADEPGQAVDPRPLEHERADEAGQARPLLGEVLAKPRLRDVPQVLERRAAVRDEQVVVREQPDDLAAVPGDRERADAGAHHHLHRLGERQRRPASARSRRS